MEKEWLDYIDRLKALERASSHTVYWVKEIAIATEECLKQTVKMRKSLGKVAKNCNEFKGQFRRK